MVGYEPLERQVRLDSHAVLEMPMAKAQPALTPVPPKAVPAKAAPRKEVKRDEIIDPFAQ
jgi:serine/threonine-protein kinase